MCDDRLGVGCVWLVHSRWRLHPHDGGGDGDGAQDWDFIPGWTPACQSSHRRGGDARGAGGGQASCQVGSQIQHRDEKKKLLDSLSHGTFWFPESVAAWTTSPWRRRTRTSVPETSSPPSTSSCLKRKRQRGQEKRRRSPGTVRRSCWDSLPAATTTVWMSKWYKLNVYIKINPLREKYVSWDGFLFFS